MDEGRTHTLQRLERRDQALNMSDETFLEAFTESLSTLPNEIKRNMDLMQDLDKSCSEKSEELKRLHQKYILQAEEKMMDLEVVQQADGSLGVRVLQGDAVVIPSTEEFFMHTYNESYDRINALQQECLQKADEKVAIAEQTLKIVDSVVQRLDRDLNAMEQILQVSGDFSTSAVLPKPDDLAACQVTPGDEWILAKVISYDSETGYYKLADEDMESSKVFNLPETQVILLQPLEKLRSGDTIFAVYPDTTSFYQCTVVSTAQRRQGYVTVSFVDDSDEFGITHDKAVPLQHLMMPPFGLMLR